MNDYQYETVSAHNDYELQEKFHINQVNNQRIVVSYRIKNGEYVSKPYYALGNATKAFFRAWAFNKMVEAK